MKGFLTIFTLIVTLSASGTHSLTYYVYYETEYFQGPWTRTDILETSDYKYLAPESFEDSFGSVDVDLVNKMLSRLRDKKPKTYNWKYDLKIHGDTVILITKGRIEQLETVKNEITASLTLNNFEAVTFRLENNQETLTINDLTLPYLDLVTGQPNTNEHRVKTDTGITDSVDTQKQNRKIKTKEKPDQKNGFKSYLFLNYNNL